MRLFFPNTTRPKKAAKHLAGHLGVSLSQAQRGVALACGYRDWHELEGALAAEPPSALDQALAKEDFIARHAHVTVTLARVLNIPDGDAQYALADARLTGDRTPALADQIAIRLACFRATSLPEAAPRTRGAVGRLKSPGRNGEVVILRSFGRHTETVSSNDSGATNSYNESLSVESDDQALYLRPMGMRLSGDEKAKLTEQGAAEFFWEMFIEPLQRD